MPVLKCHIVRAQANRFNNQINPVFVSNAITTAVKGVPASAHQGAAKGSRQGRAGPSAGGRRLSKGEAFPVHRGFPLYPQRCVECRVVCTWRVASTYWYMHSIHIGTRCIYWYSKCGTRWLLCVFFTFLSRFLSTRRTPAHPVSVLIHPREIQALRSQSTTQR